MNIFREDVLRSNLALSTSLGLELGPLDRPVVRKSDGKIIYADHLDEDALKRIYHNDPAVDCSNLHVDVVLGEKSLSQLFRPPFLLDYVIASHVIEHVPDMIGWLEDISRILRPGGQFKLAIPDRRFTFDFLRRESSLADIISAYATKATVPQPREVLDFYLNVAEVDLVSAWQGTLDRKKLHVGKRHTALALARQVAQNGNYLEIHCWVFTPKSFALLMADLSLLGLNKFLCTMFVDTQPHTLEFFVSMQPSQDVQAIAASWRHMATRAPAHGSDKAPPEAVHNEDDSSQVCVAHLAGEPSCKTLLAQ